MTTTCGRFPALWCCGGYGLISNFLCCGVGTSVADSRLVKNKVISVASDQFWYLRSWTGSW